MKNRTGDAERLLTKVASEVVAYKKQHGSFAMMAEENDGIAACEEGNGDVSCYFIDRQTLLPAKKNPFGGVVAINKLADEQLKIRFSNIPRAACPGLLLALNKGKGVTKIEIFNPDQQVVQSDTTVIPCPVETGTRVLNGVFSDTMMFGLLNTDVGTPPHTPPSTCMTSGGYQVTSFNSFPLQAADVYSQCGTQDAFTIEWTLE